MYHFQRSFRYRRLCAKCRIAALKLRNFSVKAWKSLKTKAVELRRHLVRLRPHLHHKRPTQQMYGDKKIEPLPLSGVKIQYRKIPIPELNGSRR